VMSGPHPHDIAAIRPKLHIPAEPSTDIRGWRIAFSPDLAGFDVDPEVARNTAKAAEAFRDLGAIVEDVDLGWKREEIVRGAWAHFAAIFGPWLEAIVSAHPDEVTDYAKEFVAGCKRFAASSFLEALEIEGSMFNRLSKVFRRHRLLICPTLPVPSVKAGDSLIDPPLSINGVAQPSLLHWLMTVCFNMVSRCPVMSLPSGFASTGVPTGLSIVGRAYDDVSVFRAAAAFENARPWLDAPSRRPTL
ncbi:MAG TPA: amidase family protein, partial [Dongiaceae bacterium]|nr:amidase family protein [Dongiaceae bacterium]